MKKKAPKKDGRSKKKRSQAQIDATKRMLEAMREKRGLGKAKDRDGDGFAGGEAKKRKRKGKKRRGRGPGVILNSPAPMLNGKRSDSSWF